MKTGLKKVRNQRKTPISAFQPILCQKKKKIGLFDQFLPQRGKAYFGISLPPFKRLAVVEAKIQRQHLMIFGSQFPASFLSFLLAEVKFSELKSVQFLSNAPSAPPHRPKNGVKKTHNGHGKWTLIGLARFIQINFFSDEKRLEK